MDYSNTKIVILSITSNKIMLYNINIINSNNLDRL